MMRHLIRAELYRLRHTRAALWLAGADLVCLLLLWAMRFAPSAQAAGDAADFINRFVLPALPVNAALLCSVFCGGDLHAKRVAGFSNGRILFASVFACWAYLAAVYAAAFGICCAFGAHFGFGYASVSAFLMRFVCGGALLLAWCAVFGSISFAVQERAAAALWCAVWLAAANFYLFSAMLSRYRAAARPSPSCSRSPCPCFCPAARRRCSPPAAAAIRCTYFCRWRFLSCASASVSACEDTAAEPQEVCVNDVLEDSLTQFYAAFCERGIEPKINICGERVLRFFDKQALPRIFGNIISNAVRYSDGDFSVTMRVDGVIEFENAASALDEVSAAKLFDRYFTVENGKLSTGLGLSIARTLLEKAGGEISAEWHRGRLKIALRL